MKYFLSDYSELINFEKRKEEKKEKEKKRKEKKTSVHRCTIPGIVSIVIKKKKKVICLSFLNGKFYISMIL